MRTTNRKQRLLLTATAVTATAGLMGVGSWATWSDTQTQPESINAGSFAMQLDGDLVTHADAPVINFAPGDSVTRRVDLTNTGSIDFKSISMQVTGDGESNLLDGTAKGLQVQVRECQSHWYQSDAVGSVDGWTCEDGMRPAGGYDYAYNTDELTFVGDNNGPYDVDGNWVGWEPVSSAGATLLDGPFTTDARDLQFGDLKAGGRSVLSSINTMSFNEGWSPSSTHLLVTVSMPAADGADQDVKSDGSDYARYGDQSTTLHYTFTAVQRDGNKVVAGYGVDNANPSKND
jgi:hypothetical protein